MTYDAYIITGPTASGKSDFAHRLAERIGGVIINCDSVQIYRGIENIAASPFAGRDITPDIDGISYRLFSILDLSEQISVADYLEMARREYQDATSHGRPAIFVGGTGYYINALVNGISPMPDIDANIRQQARNMVAADMAARAKYWGQTLSQQTPSAQPAHWKYFYKQANHRQHQNGDQSHNHTVISNSFISDLFTEQNPTVHNLISNLFPNNVS